MKGDIWIIGNKTEEKFLRKKTQDFDFAKFSKKETTDLLQRMKKSMHTANGVGLSANQIGLPLKVFVASVPDPDGRGMKFYAVFNPKIEKSLGEKLLLEEGCLSIPGISGRVLRNERVTISGFDKNGKRLKIKAWGLLAHVFQHEIDHLNGVLFIDKAKETYTTPEFNDGE